MKNALHQKTRRDSGRLPVKRSVAATTAAAAASHAGEKTPSADFARPDSLRQLADDRLRHFALFR